VCELPLAAQQDDEHEQRQDVRQRIEKELVDPDPVHLKHRAEVIAAPNRYAPPRARSGFQAAKMTSATAMKPRPAVIPLTT